MNKNKSPKKTYIEIIIAILFYAIFSRITPPSGLTPEGWKSIILMISCVWVWVTECIPIGISSCFLLFMPAFLGIAKTNQVLGNFAISTLFFVIGASIIAKAFIDTGLGYRLSLYITPIFGDSSKMVLLALMLCGCLISSVLVDIPTAIILAGIAYPLLEESGCKPGESNFGKAVMIGIPMLLLPGPGLLSIVGGFALAANGTRRLFS